jgi:hypothetical protein
MVDVTEHLNLLMLENDHMSYTEYVDKTDVLPTEYASYRLFLKNKGKVSKRLIKAMEWRTQARNKNLLD